MAGGGLGGEQHPAAVVLVAGEDRHRLARSRSQANHLVAGFHDFRCRRAGRAPFRRHRVPALFEITVVPHGIAQVRRVGERRFVQAEKDVPRARIGSGTVQLCAEPRHLVLAALVGSSQSRVARMESGNRSVSLDLLVRALLALGASVPGRLRSCVREGPPEVHSSAIHRRVHTRALPAPVPTEPSPGRGPSPLHLKRSKLRASRCSLVRALR